MGLPSLEYRRLRGDLIEIVKMTHEMYHPLTNDNDTITAQDDNIN